MRKENSCMHRIRPTSWKDAIKNCLTCALLSITAQASPFHMWNYICSPLIYLWLAQQDMGFIYNLNHIPFGVTLDYYESRSGYSMCLCSLSNLLTCCRWIDDSISLIITWIKVISQKIIALHCVWDFALPLSLSLMATTTLLIRKPHLFKTFECACGRKPLTRLLKPFPSTSNDMSKISACSTNTCGSYTHTTICDSTHTHIYDYLSLSSPWILCP
jgi:hypothetical protein